MARSTELSVPRRRFLKTVGFAGLTTAFAPAALSLAQSATPPSGSPPRTDAAKPAAPDTTKASAPPPPTEDAKALAAIIERRYGKYLTKEQLASIVSDFDGDLKTGERLRSVKLENSDEPDVTFRAGGGAHA
jgi:hypothetical protein